MADNKERRSDIPGFRWIFCNTCGKTAMAGATLFVSGCGHIHCSSCLNAAANNNDATSSKGTQLPLECLHCKKPMKLQKIDNNLPANVMEHFLNPNDVVRNVLKPITSIIQFQENQCRLLNKRITETRCHNQQLRSYCLQMAKMKSQFEAQLAAAQASSNDLNQTISKTPSRSSSSSAANPSTTRSIYQVHQQKQLETPSSIADGSLCCSSPGMLGCSRSSLLVPQISNSTVNSSMISAMNHMLNDKKPIQVATREQRSTQSDGKSRNESSNLRNAFSLQRSSYSGGDRGQSSIFTKLGHQSVSAPRKRDHSGNVSRGVKTAPVRKMPQEHTF